MGTRYALVSSSTSAGHPLTLNCLTDPLLTPKGTDQAYLARDTFTTELALGMPMPQVLYSSPMRRSASTLEITWDKYISSPKGHKGKKSSKGLTPIVIEHLRESIGLHTCDKRSDKGVIAATYPRFEFEEPFSFHVRPSFYALPLLARFAGTPI